MSGDAMEPAAADGRAREAADATAAEGPLGEAAADDAAARELAEHNALADVFDDVRAQSAQSALVEPTRWPEIGLVPGHLDAEEFEMLVYEYLEDERAAEAQAEAAAAPVYRTATRAVGVPRAFGGAARTEAEDGGSADAEVKDAEEASAGAADTEATVCGEASFDPAAADATGDAAKGAPSAAEAVAAGETVKDAPPAAAPPEGDDPFAGLELPPGYRLVEMEGEFVLVPDEEAGPVERVVDCSGIVALVGAHSYYLYDRTAMTDAYAHWAFLAAEDDNVVTFVDCVREDSRVYPRPLAASSLGNPPFNLAQDVVAQDVGHRARVGRLSRHPADDRLERRRLLLLDGAPEPGVCRLAGRMGRGGTQDAFIGDGRGAFPPPRRLGYTVWFLFVRWSRFAGSLLNEALGVGARHHEGAARFPQTLIYQVHLAQLESEFVFLVDVGGVVQHGGHILFHFRQHNARVLLAFRLCRCGHGILEVLRDDDVADFHRHDGYAPRARLLFDLLTQFLVQFVAMNRHVG